MLEVLNIAKKVKEKENIIREASVEKRNRVLYRTASLLRGNISTILVENKKDLEYAQKIQLSAALIDRLKLNEKRIEDMAKQVENVAQLQDVIGEIIDGWQLHNGLLIERVRVPLGVIGIIYESRPNVTIEAAALCIKSGNGVILRGGSEAINSNKILVNIIKQALAEEGLPEELVGFIETTDRAAVEYMATLNKFIDVLILRGGKDLIETVSKVATVAVIPHGEGNCHIYVDKSAEYNMAERIILNAKLQRPGVCNAVETLLVHKEVAHIFLPKLLKKLIEEGCKIYGCEQVVNIMKEEKIKIELATEEDWFKEYLDLILAVKVVNDTQEAIEHINKYGTQHSDAIITSSYEAAKEFTKKVNSACVYVNASTRFTDGYQFGLGAEIGISTAKLHARGPMSLRELTTYKYIITGEGQIRE